MYQTPSNSSGTKTASAQISDTRSYLIGIDMIAPTFGTAVLKIYDSSNNVTSGKTVISEMEVDAGIPSCNHEFVNFVHANRGLYAELTDPSGTARFIVRYALA